MTYVSIRRDVFLKKVDEPTRKKKQLIGKLVMLKVLPDSAMKSNQIPTV